MWRPARPFTPLLGADAWSVVRAVRGGGQLHQPVATTSPEPMLMSWSHAHLCTAFGGGQLAGARRGQGRAVVGTYCSLASAVSWLISMVAPLSVTAPGTKQLGASGEVV